MKIGNVVTRDATKETGEVFFLMERWEARELVELVALSIIKNPRSKKLKSLHTDLKNACCF